MPKKPSKWNWLIKAGILLLAFVAILSARDRLSKNGLGKPVEQALSVDPLSQRTAGVFEPVSVRLCESPVIELERPGRIHFFYKDEGWSRQGSNRPADDKALVGWLVKNCTVKGVGLKGQPPSNLKPGLKVVYTSGESAILWTGSGVFRWKGQIFRSASLSQALRELEAL